MTARARWSMSRTEPTRYRSLACRIGTHADCREAQPARPPVGLRITYEACVCPCHSQRSETHEGATHG